MAAFRQTAELNQADSLVSFSSALGREQAFSVLVKTATSCASNA
jgi:hypothetical protein